MKNSEAVDPVQVSPLMQKLNHVYTEPFKFSLHLASNMALWKGVTMDKRCVKAGDENAFQLYRPAFISAPVLTLLCARRASLSDILQSGGAGRGEEREHESQAHDRIHTHTLENWVRVTVHTRRVRVEMLSEAGPRRWEAERCINGGLMSEVVETNKLQWKQNQTNFQTGSKQPTQLWNAPSNKTKKSDLTELNFLTDDSRNHAMF